MIRISTARILLGIAFGMASAMAGSSARADDSPLFICYHDGGAEDNSQRFSVACFDREWAYADAQVTPNGDDGGTIDLHVTDHEACSGDSHMECIFSDGEHEVCLTESNLTTDYKGTVSFISWTCMCFTPDSPCQDHL